MIPESGNVEPLVMTQVRDLYPVNDAAYRLGITPRKVWSLIAAGRLRTRKLDGRRLVPADALAEFINSLPASGDQKASRVKARS